MRTTEHSMDSSTAKRIDLLLGGLAVFDALLAVWGFFFPELWFRFWHGAPYVDPQALLYRCAASWTAFSLLQTIARVKWRAAPWWLAITAGVRLTDLFTDLTCSLLCADVRPHTRILFPLAGAGNLLVGVLLLRWFHRLQKEAAGAPDPAL